MSKIKTRRTFREGWSEDRFLVTPADEQLDRYIDRGCNLFTSRRRNPGQEMTIEITSGNRVVSLALDFIETAHNLELLRRIEEGISPTARSYGVTQLNYPGINSRYNGAPELRHNLSQALRPSAPKMRKPQIQRRKVDGISRPVWVLYEEPRTSKEYDITYEGAHRIGNASALLTVNVNPGVGDTLTVISNDIAETEFTFVASGATTYQINVGGSPAATAANIKAKLIALLTNDEPAEPGFDIDILGAALTITAADGDDFTIEIDSDNITITNTAALFTIPDNYEVYFYQILEALAMRGLRTEHLAKGQSIKEVQDEARQLLNEALDRITPRAS